MTQHQNTNQRSQLRKNLLWITLLVFGTYSTWVLWQVGYVGIWEGGFAELGSTQILFDLAIACFIVCSWIIGDARSRGVSAAPWIIATMLTGSIALLVYLLVREYSLSGNNASENNRSLAH